MLLSVKPHGDLAVAGRLCRGYNAAYLRDGCRGIRRNQYSAFAFPSQLFQQLDLDLLNLEQTVVLPAQQMIDFFV
jgi:hypothetical protein